MRKRDMILDWQTFEEGAAWLPEKLPSGVMPKARRFSWRRYWWALAVGLAVLLTAFVAGYREVRRADQAMDRVEHDVRAAVAADGMRQLDRNTGMNPPVAPYLALTPEPGVKVGSIEVRDDYAMAEVWTIQSDEPWLPAPYRQTHFFQETARGWLPVGSPDAFYQPLARLQAGRFMFVYGPRDADAVREAATQIEKVDVEIRTEVGLPATSEALTVKIIADPLPGSEPVELTRLSHGPELFTPSPALLRLPAHISEGDALLQLVAGLLIERDLDEAQVFSPRTCHWRSLAQGLRLWLLNEHSKLPSQTRYEAERWRQFKIAHGRIPYLTWVAPDHNACSRDPIVRESAGSDTNASVAPAVVAFAMATHGRARLVALLNGMQRYDTWETLIPAVFEVSAEQFEAGWQEYWLRDGE
jgi:hypothetical protein